MSEGLPAEVRYRIVGVLVNGYYCWKKRPPSARAVRHAMLAEVIREVHNASRQTYGARVSANWSSGEGSPLLVAPASW